MMKAKVTDELIENIFSKNTPLHDGAVIINENKILAARCILPVLDRRIFPEVWDCGIGLLWDSVG